MKFNNHYAQGRLKAGEMNKTEAAYAAHLALLLHAGTIKWFQFDKVKLRLADGCFYTCDFAVMTDADVIEMHEVKGFWTDDARVKTKVASSLYPFRFLAVKPRTKRDGGGWSVEEF